MNMKVILIFLLTLVILAGIPTSFAQPQYLASLTKVYGEGSCGTCHVNASSDGPRTSYGTSFETQANHAADPSAALRAIGAPPTATTTLTPIATLTPEVTTVSTTATPVPPVATTTPAAPGFGIVASMVGLFAWALLVKRNNK